MANSLLAHLYSRIRGSQEDVATIALQYLLSQSEELNKTFTSLVASCLKLTLDENLHYICQSVGEGKERPDMAGVDKNGHEAILCEMKFYAGLTRNQPLGYLNRLKEKNGTGLIFVCPKSRQTSLWTKLKDICAERQMKSVDTFCVCVDGIHMAILTWTEIIEQLRKVAASSAVEYLSDIQQLEGYCAQMDSDAFIPFASEDLTADNAKRANRYYEVIDQTIALLCEDDTITTSLKGVKATAYRKGYTRSLYLDDFTLSLNYDRDLWKSNSSMETPFWVGIRDKEWKQTAFFRTG